MKMPQLHLLVIQASARRSQAGAAKIVQMKKTQEFADRRLAARLWKLPIEPRDHTRCSLVKIL